MGFEGPKGLEGVTVNKNETEKKPDVPKTRAERRAEAAKAKVKKAAGEAADRALQQMEDNKRDEKTKIVLNPDNVDPLYGIDEM